MDALASFGMTVIQMLRDVIPIAAILIGFQLFVLRKPILNPARVAMVCSSYSWAWPCSWKDWK